MSGGSEETLRRALAALQGATDRIEALERERSEPLAIVGMACRFPGGASSPAGFWRMLTEGVDAVVETRRRWPDVEVDSAETRWAALLDAIDGFDPHFFGISPREAASLDPQQRLLLEVSWEALEDAAMVPAALSGSRTGVFVGIASGDYRDLVMARRERDVYDFTGNIASTAAGRLSFVLGLQGPCVAIDTACSSSLVALHLACRSLRSRESDVALAGGVNVILSRRVMEFFGPLRFLSPDGRCKTFDAGANGFVRGEGCGVVVLKRLSDAERDGDRIWAVVRGSAVNQDGRSTGLTTPNVLAQQAVLRAALADARVGPETIAYVETHGTGTSLGDPIEVEALREVLGQPRADGLPCFLGAVKTNLGHLEAAAGIAGLIKAALCVAHGRIPRNLHFRALNPHTSLEGTPFVLPTAPQPWPAADARRRAGVSSFGISGTNAHVVLEAAPPTQGLAPSATARPHHLLALSARTPASLVALAQRYADTMQGPSAPPLADVCHAAAVGRSHFEERLALTACDSEEARAKLESIARGEVPAGCVRDVVRLELPPKVAFLFTGQGSQYTGMGRELYDSQPVFRDALDQCAQLLQPVLPRPLLSVMFDASGELDATQYTQPALFALEWALAALWRSWGIVPDAVIGHSVGELVAACVAGVLGLEDALKLTATRGRLMGALPPEGAMAALRADERTASEAIGPHGDEVTIAALNGPGQTVISGRRERLIEICRRLEAKGIKSSLLKVSHAFHSPLMEPILAELERVAGTLRYQAPGLTLVSNLTGMPLGPADVGPAYWRRHAREAVRFVDGMKTLDERGVRLFVEVGPQPVLSGMAAGVVAEGKALWLASLRKGRSAWETMLDGLARLYTSGVAIDWRGFDRPYVRRRVDVPTYAFDRRRYWVEPDTVPDERAAVAVHPLGGRRLAVPGTKGVLECVLSVERVPYLADHIVFGTTAVPAAAMLELVDAARVAFAHEPSVGLSEIVLEEALVLPPGGERRVQVAVATDGAVRLSSRAADDANEQGWTRHLSCRLAIEPAAQRTTGETIAALRARCRLAADVAAAYAQSGAAGLQLGPVFQNVRALWRGEGEALAEIALSEAERSTADRYGVHPALFDAAMQTVASVLAQPSPDAVWLPIEFGAVRTYKRGAARGWAHVRLEEAGASPRVSVALMDDDGELIFAVDGVRLLHVEQKQWRRARQAKTSRLFFSVRWLEAALPEAEAPASGTWWVLGEAGAVADTIVQRLDASGVRCVRALDAAAAAGHCREPPTGVVCLFAPHAGEPPAAAVARHVSRGLAIVQALAALPAGAQPRLWWTTIGGVAAAPGDTVDPALAALWALGRVVMQEHPELDCRLVDSWANTDEAGAAFALELARPGDEDQVALRRGRRWVPRLVPAEDESAAVPAAPNVRLELGQPGALETLRLLPAERRAPGPDELEVEVRAAGPSFHDVFTAPGGYPGEAGPLGLDLAGVVSAVGRNVTDLRVGDRVMGLARATFARYVTVGRAQVCRVPAGLSFAEAATIPVAFVTAWYALHDLAELEANEKVLVHAAADAVGMAATQLAQQAGAVVLGTASDAERSVLTEMGIRHVADSRSTAFADSFRTAVGSVDVVLNALHGDLVDAGLSLLRPGGRFLDMGRRDVRQASAVSVQYPGVSYRAFDLGELPESRLDQILQAVAAGLDRGELRPLPAQVFDLRQAAALRVMARAGHIGKVVLVPPRARAASPGGTVIVTGGLGALGLAVAEWLVDAQGVRSLVLVGRHGASSQQAERVEALRRVGAEVTVATLDVANSEAVQELVSRLIRDRPLRGVIHAAGVVDDGILVNQTMERVARVLAPKVGGAWNLHAATRALDLEFFVMFSSIASLAPSAGLGSYAAANAFMDGLAQLRQSQGLPALSVNWGPWSGGGMSAGLDRSVLSARHRQGLKPLPPEKAVEAFERLIETAAAAQVCVASLDFAAVGRSFARGRVPPLWRKVVKVEAKPATPGGLWAESASDLPRGEGRAAAEKILRDHLRRILSLGSEVEIPSNRPIRDFGLDSLMAVELRQRVKEVFAVDIPLAVLVQEATLGSIATRVADETAADAPPRITPAVSDAATSRGDGDRIPRVLNRRTGPLSTSQERFWLVGGSLGSTPISNDPIGMSIAGQSSPAALQAAFGEISRRHEVLRSVVVADHPGGRQAVVPPAPLGLPLVDLSAIAQVDIDLVEAALTTAETARVFDIHAERPRRLRLIQRSADTAMLMVTTHHIADDGLATNLTITELGTLFDAFTHGLPSPLDEFRVQYLDFAVWSRTRGQGAALESSGRYWEKQLEGATDLLDMDGEGPCPSLPTFRARFHSFQLPATLANAVKATAHRESVSLFTVVLSALYLLAHRWSSLQDDINIATPYFGRPFPELRQLIGNFVNPIVLRQRLWRARTGSELMKAVNRDTLAALEHADLPYERVIEAVRPLRHPGRPPLTQALYTHVPASLTAVTNNAVVSCGVLPAVAVDFAWLLRTWEEAEHLAGHWVLSEDLYAEHDARELTRDLQAILAQLARDPSLELSLLASAAPLKRGVFTVAHAGLESIDGLVRTLQLYLGAGGINWRLRAFDLVRDEAAPQRFKLAAAGNVGGGNLVVGTSQGLCAALGLAGDAAPTELAVRLRQRWGDAAEPLLLAPVDGTITNAGRSVDVLDLAQARIALEAASPDDLLITTAAAALRKLAEASSGTKLGVCLLRALEQYPTVAAVRAALAASERAATDVTSEAVTRSMSPVEAAVAAVVVEVLGIQSIGLTDNFFALGGDSLRATQIIVRLQEMFQVELMPQDLFAAPTVAGVSDAVVRAMAAQTESGEESL